jgi:hypothetical protein
VARDKQQQHAFSNRQPGVGVCSGLHAHCLQALFPLSSHTPWPIGPRPEPGHASGCRLLAMRAACCCADSVLLRPTTLHSTGRLREVWVMAAPPPRLLETGWCSIRGMVAR